jgi:UDP-N-acetylmuramyl pentapeptide phosphotransferase/UDP-N-acetylglucosamine-1-phosphate transferase
MLSSVNLIDGHDGLAAGVASISALAFAVIGGMIGAPDVVSLSLAVGGACVGFLFFNFPPGRIYMGDTGSMLLGLLLALLACTVSMRSHSPNMFAAVCFGWNSARHDARDHAAWCCVRCSPPTPCTCTRAARQA